MAEAATATSTATPKRNCLIVPRASYTSVRTSVSATRQPDVLCRTTTLLERIVAARPPADQPGQLLSRDSQLGPPSSTSYVTLSIKPRELWHVLYAYCFLATLSAYVGLHLISRLHQVTPGVLGHTNIVRV